MDFKTEMIIRFLTLVLALIMVVYLPELLKHSKLWQRLFNKDSLPRNGGCNQCQLFNKDKMFQACPNGEKRWNSVNGWQEEMVNNYRLNRDGQCPSFKQKINNEIQDAEAIKENEP